MLQRTNQHTYIYKVPYELDRTVRAFIFDMLNYACTLSLLTEFTAQLKASSCSFSIQRFECRRRLKKAVQSEDRKSQKEFHTKQEYPPNRFPFAEYLPFWKEALQIF